jgi:hypothetical protein
VILKNVLVEDSRYHSVIFELRKLPSLGIASVVSLAVIGEAERQQAKSSPLAAGETRTEISKLAIYRHIPRIVRMNRIISGKHWPERRYYAGKSKSEARSR